MPSEGKDVKCVRPKPDVHGSPLGARSGDWAALFALIIAVIDVHLIGAECHETIGGLRLIRPHDNGCPMMIVSVLSVPLDRMPPFILSALKCP